LKQSTRVTGFLHRCPLFATQLRSNGRAKCGSPVTVCGAKDMLFNQRSSSALQAGTDKLADAVGITTCPRGNLGTCILTLRLTVYPSEPFWKMQMLRPTFHFQSKLCGSRLL